VNRIALGLVALAFSSCSWGPFTLELTKDSNQSLWGARTESAIFGAALLIQENKICWAEHIKDHANYGCIERK